MDKYKILVADDEPLTRERICNLLKKYSNFSVLSQTSNGVETLNAIKKYKPDVVFLDIRMPRLNGLEILKFLDTNDYRVLVFITAYDQYAIQAFENEALDYLLKPFNNTRFDKLMQRLEKQLKHLCAPVDKHILVRTKNEILKINTKKIIYIKSDNNYVQLHLENQVLRKRISISSMLDQLDAHFCRIHRFYIINQREIRKMKHVCHGDYFFLMSNGKSIPSSRSYRKIVKLITK